MHQTAKSLLEEHSICALSLVKNGGGYQIKKTRAQKTQRDDLIEKYESNHTGAHTCARMDTNMDIHTCAHMGMVTHTHTLLPTHIPFHSLPHM